MNGTTEAFARVKIDALLNDAGWDLADGSLVFRYGGATGPMMSLRADNDGFKLDANHDQPVEDDDLTEPIDAFQDRDSRWAVWRDRYSDANGLENWWLADAVRAADFRLSANRHARRTGRMWSTAIRSYTLSVLRRQQWL